MSMKAQKGTAIGRVESKPRDPQPGDGWKDRGDVEFPERKKSNLHSADDSNNPDELVMVMMPRITYDAFLDLAKEYGGSTAQAISMALKLLEETLKKAGDSDDD